MSRLINTLNVSKLSRTVTTKYDNYECNTLLCLYNMKNVSKYEIKTIKKHHKLKDIEGIKEIDMNFIIKQGFKICSTISEEYLLEKMEDSKIIFILLSRKIPNMTLRNPKILQYICGLMFLDIMPSYVYLSLICAQRGLGAPLLKLSEELAGLFGYKKVRLDSLEAPFPFYLKNNYRLDNGYGTYNLFDKDIDEPLVNPPEDLESKYKTPYVGIIHKFRNKYWIYVGDSTKYEKTKWKFIQPGFIVLYTRMEDASRVYYIKNKMFSDETFKHILSKIDRTTKYTVKDKDGKKIRLNKNAGLVSKLINISTVGSDFIKMSKTLSTPMYGIKRLKKSKKKK